MAHPTTRQGLIDYAFRQLGFPVLEINVDDDQVDDLLDDALQIFTSYHYDGVERVFVKHMVTQADIDNEYITLDDSILSVVRVFPFLGGRNTVNIFDIRYQMHLHDVYDLHTTEVMHYDLTKRHINLVDQMLQGEQSIEFRRHTNTLYIHADWNRRFVVGSYIVLEVFKILDPEDYPAIYNDEFLKAYFTSLLKKQWGTNLKKFDGVQLPGGITLNGKEIYDEAVEEIRQLKEDLDNRHTQPPRFFVG